MERRDCMAVHVIITTIRFIFRDAWNCAWVLYLGVIRMANGSANEALRWHLGESPREVMRLLSWATYKVSNGRIGNRSFGLPACEQRPRSPSRRSFCFGWIIDSSVVTDWILIFLASLGQIVACSQRFGSRSLWLGESLLSRVREGAMLYLRVVEGIARRCVWFSRWLIFFVLTFWFKKYENEKTCELWSWMTPLDESEDACTGS